MHRNCLAALCHQDDDTPELQNWFNRPIYDTLVSTEWYRVAGEPQHELPCIAYLSQAAAAEVGTELSPAAAHILILGSPEGG